MVIEVLKPMKDVSVEYTWALNAKRAIGEKWVKLMKYQR
jgi:hypothetical protein